MPEVDALIFGVFGFYSLMKQTLPRITNAFLEEVVHIRLAYPALLLLDHSSLCHPKPHLTVKLVSKYLVNLFKQEEGHLFQKAPRFHL